MQVIKIPTIFVCITFVEMYNVCEYKVWLLDNCKVTPNHKVRSARQHNYYPSVALAHMRYGFIFFYATE